MFPAEKSSLTRARQKGSAGRINGTGLGGRGQSEPWRSEVQRASQVPERAGPHHGAQARIAGEHPTVAVQRRHAVALHVIRSQATDERADGGGERPGEVVPGEDARAAGISNDVGEGRLLDGQERLIEPR